jgi:hypothetical protein
VHIKKHLSFTALRKSIGEHFDRIDDHRQSGRVDFSLHDCLMSALAMMFFQDRSILSFQRRMQDSMQSNNLKTMFGVESIPSDDVLRKTIDPVATEDLDPCFSILFHHLQRGKQLAPYKLDSGYYLVAIDGSQYFTSEKIHCSSCLTYKHSKKKLRYSHQILQAVMLAPGMRQVIPLPPEPIIKADGDTENDCERSAGKRLIGKIRATHPKLKMMITGDGLYSNQPFIDTLKENHMSYVLVAKPTDHKILFQWVEELDGLGEVEHKHNFGHGSHHLSNNFFVLNVLAFCIHQILELCDRGYQYCRSKFSSRKEYWNILRGVIKIMLFRNFEHLLRNVADPPEIMAPG